MDKTAFQTFCNNFKAGSTVKEPLVMGILNLTPDSFSDGGALSSLPKAFDKAMALVDEGADLLDIGGESSRPGASPVSLQAELDRVLPLIEKLTASSDICLSIDSTRPTVMAEAARRGIGLINDVNALQAEGAVELAASLEIPVCLMHRQGDSKTMQSLPFYQKGFIGSLNDFFAARIKACQKANIAKTNLILDPGFGFGKTDSHNLQMINEMESFHQHDLPLMLGFSRKNTIGVLLNKPVSQRLTGGLVLTVMAAIKGVSILRTHDVDATRQALKMVYHLNAEKENQRQ